MSKIVFIFFFVVIAIKPHPLPYLNALLPKDQDLLAQEEETPPAQTKKSLKSKEGEITEQETPDPEAIDNPYLRPVKMARNRKKGVGDWKTGEICSTGTYRFKQDRVLFTKRICSCGWCKFIKRVSYEGAFTMAALKSKKHLYFDGFGKVSRNRFSENLEKLS